MLFFLFCNENTDFYSEKNTMPPKIKLEILSIALQSEGTEWQFQSQ